MTVLRVWAAVFAALSIACAGSERTPPQSGTGVKTEANARPAPAAPGTYQADIQQFQHDREMALTTDTGWLTVAGLFFLAQPRMTFGSDPLNDIGLPASAPAQAGTVESSNGKVTVKAAPRVPFQLGDKTATT